MYILGFSRVPVRGESETPVIGADGAVAAAAAAVGGYAVVEIDAVVGVELVAAAVVIVGG